MSSFVILAQHDKINDEILCTHMDTITITDITNNDIAEVRYLGLATPELQIGNEETAYYSEEMLRSFITSKDDIHLAAKKGDILIAYLLASINPHLQEAYLIDMVVKPEWRGKGIATSLFQTAFQKLNDNGCVWAWGLVHEDNEKMMRILEKKGFSQGRKFRIFYKVRPF